MAPQQSAASLGPVLSFGDTNKQAEEEEPTKEEEYGGAASVDHDSGDDDDESFEFAFAPPLAGAAGSHQAEAAPADDIFAHGRILPAYPVFDRRLLLQAQEHEHEQSSSSAAVPEPDTYCAWVPRSAPGSPARRDATAADAVAVPFPKSASTGEPRRLRLRDVLLGSSGRSHSDGKEKFVFLQPSPTPKSSSSAPAAAAKKSPATPSPMQHKQQQGNGNGSKKKGAAVTEMDMATAHRLFYSKTGTTGGGGGGERKLQTSFLTYRPAFVGFFASAPGRSSHHPY